MKRALAGCMLALVFWGVIFSPWSRGRVSFWLALPMATGLLAALGVYWQRSRLGELFRFQPSHLAAGLVSAAGLYGVFWLGHLAATALLGFAREQVAWIYGLREGLSPAVLAALLLWVSVCEELFWRGAVQDRFARAVGHRAAYVLAAGIYALVHIWSLNLMLLAAALLCGLTWGGLLLRYRSLWPGLISHVAWDVLIFAVLPIG